MSISSVSKKQLILEINEKKQKFLVILKRHLSPRTVGTIMRSLAVGRSCSYYWGKVLFILKHTIDSGTERARTEFKKGDVAFLPSSGSLCFFTHDAVLNLENP